MTPPFPSPRAARVAAVLGPAVLGLALHAAMLRSVAAQLYSGEAAGVGRLQWELTQGTFAWDGLARFVLDHTYQYFAQGTAALQAVAFLLSPLLGHTLVAQHAAALVLQACGVMAFAAALLRVTSPGVAALGALVLVLPPTFVATFGLMPYGNHTEFLWVPLLLALAVAAPPERRTWPAAAALGAFMALGQVLYRLDGLASVAALVVLAWGRDRRSWGIALLAGASGLLVSALAFRPLGLSPLGMNPEALGSFPSPRPQLDALLANLTFALQRGIPTLPLGPDGGALHRGLLLVAAGLAAAAWRPGSPGPHRDLSRFASLWAALALAAPVVTNNPFPRYFVHAFVALSLCLVLQLGGPRAGLRRAALAAVVLLALAGAVRAVPFVAPSTWDRPMPDHALWFALEVDALDADEQPFYARILREGRGSPWVGRSSHHSSNLCPRWPGTGPEAPAPTADHCAGWQPGELATVVADVVRRTTPETRQAALEDLGRGAWIRSNRDLLRTARAVEGAEAAAVEAVLRGARDEARRAGTLGGHEAPGDP